MQQINVGTQEIAVSYEESFLHYEVDQTLKQIAQRGGCISILGGTQNSTGQVPEQPNLVGHALSQAELD